MVEPNAIARRIDEIKATLPAGVELVAVSKFHPLSAIMDAYSGGQRVFGESRVQELQAKVEELAAYEAPELRWHFIGHLQTNKVRQLLRLRPALIESVDSERLLSAIDREAEAQGIVQPVLLQVHVAREETKTGLSPEEFAAYFRERRFEGLKATHIRGIMGMASNTDDAERVRADFKAIRGLFDLALATCPDLRDFTEVSMGMSGDYPIAVEEGATMVRVGSAIFGARAY